MKIDIYNHIFPKRFYDAMMAVMSNPRDMLKRVTSVPMLVDLDERFRVMDRFGDYCQVLSLASPPLELLVGPQRASEFARIANDGMAELVRKHPDRFPAFVASVGLGNPAEAAKEMHRAVKELGAKGIQIFTNAGGRPLDEPDFLPLFEGMAAYDLPLWMHPTRGPGFADYPGEKKSKYEIWWTLGWPYETSVAMAHLAFAGLFDKLPNLKIITHHMGGMMPYFEGRIGPGWDQMGSRTSDEDYPALLKSLNKRPIDYMRMFYADTALFGADSATRCGLDFFGVDHVVFASDAPFDPEKGPMYIRETIRVIDGLDIPAPDKARIYEGNARRLLRLPAH